MHYTLYIVCYLPDENGLLQVEVNGHLNREAGMISATRFCAVLCQTALDCVSTLLYCLVLYGVVLLCTVVYSAVLYFVCIIQYMIGILCCML